MTIEATIEKPAVLDIDAALRSPVVRQVVHEIAAQLRARMISNALSRARNKQEKRQLLAAYIAG
jgi:hypothetical protein